MIYLIGGAPRVGKSLLGQHLSARLNIGWISTDLLAEVLKVGQEDRTQEEWNAAPEAVAAKAEQFYPYLERFVWGVLSMAEHYLIEGVNFLPAQVAQLSQQYPIRPIFLGCSRMTLGRFEQFPGCSPGYAGLPQELKQQIVQDVPLWSEFIRQQAGQYGYPYVDMGHDFLSGQREAENALVY